MSAILRSRRTLIPLAAAAATGAILLPAAIPASAANGFATQVVSESQALVGSATNTVVTSAASILAQTPALLKTLPLNDTASILAAPQSSTPLVDVLNGSTSAAPLSRALLGPALAAASDPTADAIAALQSIFGKLGDAFAAAPNDITMAAGQLLGGDLRTALQTLSNIIVKPLVLIGLVDLPPLSAALSQLNPFFAPVFNAFPNIAINIVVTALQLFTNAREGVATIYEGVRDGLKAGDLGAAGAAITTGFSNILAQGNIDLFGENGFLSALRQSGDDFLNAINQLGKPAPTTDTLRASTNAAVAPSTESTTPASAATATTAGTETATATGSTSGSSKAADTTSTATENATTPEPTTPAASTPETSTPAAPASGTVSSGNTSTASTTGSTPVATHSGTATTSGTSTSGTAATGTTATGSTAATATSSESAAPAASKAGAAAPSASASE
ncbi:hypothetical protein ACQ7HM_03530 [Williamsia sp. MIQD14]|uniref:hypothetical protein n=1 Tax=Williamsia sp. MIQD14 TaxID=3425703 RepID=UPI003D9FD6DC